MQKRPRLVDFAKSRHALVTLFCYINMSPNTTCLPAGTLASGAKLLTTSYLFDRNSS